MEKEKIAVIGAGVMGQGVAHQFSKYGYDVTLVDVNEDKLQAASAGIRNIERLDLLMQKSGKSPQSINQHILQNIALTTSLSALKDASVIIENVPEKIEVKTSVYKELHHVVSDTALVAVNTSATPIGILSALLRHPERVMGMHFVNPVHLMPTLELVKGANTSDDTIQRAFNLLAAMKMKGVLVNDAPGFVSNRVMLMYINEAAMCVEEGIGTANAVDQIFRECLSHKMGPLQTADLIGIDTILYSLEVLHHSFANDKYKPADILRQMVSKELLGIKKGQGFYKY